MLRCVSIQPKNVDELYSYFEEAKALGDCVEVRLDGFSDISWDILWHSLQDIVQKGSCLLKAGAPEQVEALARLAPAYLDIPSEAPSALFTRIRAMYPNIRLIASYHNYEETPCDLEAVIEKMKGLGAHMQKCVCHAKSGLDGLRMLSLLKKMSGKTALSAFCMGESGQFTRILAPVFGACINYYSLPGRPTAPGQLSILEPIYKRSTEVFALIGYPVAHSKSHKTHNAVFRQKGIDAVYVKIEVQEADYDAAMHHITALAFSGLSVTMPLKQKVGGNTVRGTAVCTTDGLGMLDAVEEKVKVTGKTVLILGAGGTAESIAKEAIKRGASVLVCNRTFERGMLLAKRLGCGHIPWQSPLPNYDVLIQATSVGMKNGAQALPFGYEDISPGAVVADVISTEDTVLLQMARKRGCQVVTGHEMWLRQAAHQFSFWKKELAIQEVHALLKGAL